MPLHAYQIASGHSIYILYNSVKCIPQYDRFALICLNRNLFPMTIFLLFSILFHALILDYCSKFHKVFQFICISFIACSIFKRKKNKQFLFIYAFCHPFLPQNPQNTILYFFLIFLHHNFLFVLYSSIYQLIDSAAFIP